MPIASPAMRLALLLILPLAAIAGCARSIDVIVVNRTNGDPVADARVTRYSAKRHWLGGFVHDTEEGRTDARGVVRLQNRKGAVSVSADGFHPQWKDVEQDRRMMRVELYRWNPSSAPARP